MVGKMALSGWWRRVAARWTGSPAGAAVLLGALALYGLMNSPLWQVREIRVVGLQGADEPLRQTVLARLERAGFDNIWSVDARRAVAAVPEDPRIIGVAVRRRLPGTLELQVHRRPMVAVAAYAGGFVGVDATGLVLGATPAGGELPVITGAVAPGEVLYLGQRGPLPLVSAARVADVAGKPLGKRLSEVHAAPDGALYLILEDGSRVVWERLLDGEPGGAPAPGTVAAARDALDRERVRVLLALLERLDREGRHGWVLDLARPDRAVWHHAQDNPPPGG